MRGFGLACCGHPVDSWIPETYKLPRQTEWAPVTGREHGLRTGHTPGVVLSIDLRCFFQSPQPPQKEGSYFIFT